MKKLKKVICIFLLLLMLMTNSFACTNLRREGWLGAKITMYYSEDSSVQYTAYSTDMNFGRITVPQRSSGYYYFKYDVYYKTTGEVVLTEDLWYTTVSAVEVGETLVTDFIGVGGKLCEFGVYVIVEDTRVRPTLVIDPAGAIEYIENERYVYKYDGKQHMPKASYCEYNGEKIEFEYCYTLKESNWDYILYVSEIGVYEVLYKVGKYKNEIDNTRFHLITIHVIIEVIA